MRSWFLLFIALGLLTSCSVFHSSGQTESAPRRGFISRFFDIFRGSPEDPGVRIARGLKMEMTLSPLPVKLSEVRRIEVVVRITNRTRRIIQLEFPTQQRLEIVLKDDSGRVVTQWSEDQYFAQSRSYLTINPREHVDYSEKMPTRDLVANRSYTLEAFLPGYAELAVRETFVPVP